MSVLTSYEGNAIKAHLVVDELTILADWFDAAISGGDQHKGAKDALEKSSRKLRSYLSDSPTARFRQPAANFLCACRVLDVANAMISRTSVRDVINNIPWFGDDLQSQAELCAYLSRMDYLDSETHPVKFWLTARPSFPKLSTITLSCLSIPVNSVSAERSFSMYSDVLRDDRRSIRDSNLSPCIICNIKTRVKCKIVKSTLSFILEYKTNSL